jgi:hypothetical protein
MATLQARRENAFPPEQETAADGEPNTKQRDEAVLGQVFAIDLRYTLLIAPAKDEGAEEVHQVIQGILFTDQSTGQQAGARLVYDAIRPSGSLAIWRL